MKSVTSSFAFLVLAVLAYMLAGLVMGLFLIGTIDPDTDPVLVPFSLLTGLISNTIGALLAILSFFTVKKKKWLCVVPLALNGAPPLIVLMLMAVGFVLIG